MGEPSEVVIPLFGVLDITGEIITMWLIIAILAALSIYVGKHLKERPGKLQNVIETGIEYLDNTFTGNLGRTRCRRYFYFLGSLFIFIIFANYSGLIPGVGLTKYLKAPTSSLSVTVGLGICTFIFLQAASIRAKGIKGYIKHFISPIIVMLLVCMPMPSPAMPSAVVVWSRMSTAYVPFVGNMLASTPWYSHSSSVPMMRSVPRNTW